MKKVRYAFGAVGAVPAVGMMMPATAAATAHAQKATAKTVSLQRRSAAASGCTGNTYASAKNISVKLFFWHTYNPTSGTSCIGTVDTSFLGGVGPTSYDRVRIYAHYLNGAKHRVYSRQLWGAYPPKHFFDDGVHRSYGYLPIQVCTAAVSSIGSQVKQGPVCKSVG